MIKSLDFFFWYSKCFISGIFFVLVKSYSISPVLLQRIMKKKLCSCLFLKKVSKILHPKIWTNPATRVLTFYHGDLAGTPGPNLWEIIVDLNLWWEFVKFVYTSVADPGEGPGGFRPNRGPKGRKNFFGRPPPAPLSNGLDDRPQPPPPPPPHHLKVWIRHYNFHSKFLFNEQRVIFFAKWQLLHLDVEHAQVGIAEAFIGEKGSSDLPCWNVPGHHSRPQSHSA